MVSGLRGLLAYTAAVALVLLPFSQAQILPSVGLAAEVLEAEYTPTGITFYGTPRTFEATVINVGTGNGDLGGNITFLAAGVPICTTPLIADNSVVSAGITLNQLTLTLASGLLNNVLPGLSSTTQGLINIALGVTGLTDANLNAVSDLVGKVQVQAAAIAFCTTSTIPVGSYTALSVAFAGLSVGGLSTGVPAILPAILGPLVNLGDFQVVKAADTVQAATPAPTLPGASTPLTGTVVTTSPGSVLPPDGGTVTAFLGTTQIGSGPVTPGTTGTTSTFSFPITVPTGTAPGSQLVTLQYSGTSNFNPSASGANGNPAGPTLTVPYVVAFTGTPTPTTPPAGTNITVAGTATTPGGGPAPTGTVTLTVNGVTTGPFTLTPGTGSTSTFSGTLTAPAQPSNGTPYPVTINYTPDVPAFTGPTPPATFPLTVGLATGAVAITVTPPNPASTAPVTVNGTVTGSNGLPPAGTVDIKVDGNTVLPGVPVNPDGTFTGTFPAPGPGMHTVTATYNPDPGNSIGSATSPPKIINVGPATSTITQTVTPNPAPPGGPVTVAGTVTNTDGTSPAGGTVIVYLNGVPVGTATVGADGKFNIPFTAPTTPGTYTLLTTYTPFGATAPTASVLTIFTVSASGGGGTTPTNITISFGNGGNGFTFPNCLGPLSISVSGSGTPSPTGNVTLSISGGKIGSIPITLGSASFVNGVATFNFESLAVKKELLDKAISHLLSFKQKLTLEDIHNSDLLPAGDFLLLPGAYTLTASYPGDSIYAASTGTAPFNVDPLCLLLALALRG